MTNSFDMAGTEFTTQGLACGMYVALARYVLHQCYEIRTISFYFLANFFDFPLYSYPALIVSLYVSLYYPVSLYISLSFFLCESLALLNSNFNIIFLISHLFQYLWKRTALLHLSQVRAFAVHWAHNCDSS